MNNFENEKEAFGNVATQVRQGAEQAGKKFDKFAERAQKQTEKTFDEAQEALAEGQGRAEQFLQDASLWVRTNPWQVAAIAATTALALTLLIRRTSSRD